MTGEKEETFHHRKNFMILPRKTMRADYVKGERTLLFSIVITFFPAPLLAPLSEDALTILLNGF